MSENRLQYEKIADSELSNYYGGVTLTRYSDGTYYLQLEDWDRVNRVKVSPEFAEAFTKEFMMRTGS